METNLYRKYRPNNFSQVVGQEVVVQTLLNAIKNESTAHAYLFSGVRGTGKTSVAKIFAKAINCQTSDNPLCGTCEVCQEYAASSEVPDIFEIDAASNNGVEEIRKIIENVKYMPIRMKYKVYIIDEVHMLSKGAFNALLKTLEEPPAHVIFILATTEPNKIPVTILSRVQRFEFTRISEKLMLEHLCNVLDAEQVNYDTSALELIVSHAGGGLRDALSLLTKVISYAPEVTNQTVTVSLNLASKSVTSDLLDAIVAYQPQTVSESFKQLIDGGVDETYLVQDLIEDAKSRMMKCVETGDDNAVIYTKVIRRLIEALANIKIISNSCLYIEVALIELAIKPKETVAPVIATAAEPKQPKVSEQEKLDKLKMQAELLKAKPQESEPRPEPEPEPQVAPVEASNPVTNGNDEVETQIDMLFANKTGKVFDDQNPPSVDLEPEPEHIEIEHQYNETIEPESKSIISEITSDEPAPVAPEVTQPELDPELEDITIIDTLKHATKLDKQKAQKAALSAADELNRTKQYGIAKFFEVSSIQGASPSGVVVSIEQNLYSTYESRIAQIQQIYSNHIGSSVKVHLLTTQYWKQERMNFVRAVKENKQVDIYQEATDFFGKDLVNKVNS